MPLHCLNCSAEHPDTLSPAAACPACRMAGMLRHRPASTGPGQGSPIAPPPQHRHQCHNCGEAFSAAAQPEECPACRIRFARQPASFAVSAAEASEPQGSAVSDTAVSGQLLVVSRQFSTHH